MKLVIKRDQDRGFMGGMSFILEAKVELTPEEQELVKKYKAHKQILFIQGDKYSYTIDSLISGTRDKCKDVTILLENEKVIKDACQNFRILLDVMASFGGQEVFEY